MKKVAPKALFSLFFPASVEVLFYNGLVFRLLWEIANLEKIFSQSVSWAFFALIGVNFNTHTCKYFLIKKSAFSGAF
ncbi:hypothetical protein HQ39_02795 [Porphyromonas sp. COT-108 OH2963]|nr:hypothetical protein HQ39_02795 [Porphyromonas sp. COT-108 OH2963]